MVVLIRPHDTYHVFVAYMETVCPYIHRQSFSNPFGIPFLVLCSPKKYPPEFPSSNLTGSLFTYLLQDPLSALASVMEIDFKTVTAETIEKVGSLHHRLDVVSA